MEFSEVINEYTILDIVLEGRPNEHTQIKYSTVVDDDLSPNKAVTTMRNMLLHRALRNGPLHKSRGRESAMVSTASPSAVAT